MSYVSRTLLGWGRWPASLAVLGCYGVLCVLALAWLGWTWRGLAGAFGMLLPCALALALIVVPVRAKRF